MPIEASETPVIVVAAVAFVRDGHVLTVRKQGTDRFMLVGGKPEPGEGPAETARRESREEVGVVVEELVPLGEFVSAAANEPGHELHSTVFTAELTSEPAPAAEIAELRWVPLTDDGDHLAPMLVQNVLPLLRAAAG